MNCQQCNLGVRHVAITLASADDERLGLLAWDVVDLGVLLVDSVTVRRTMTGELRVVMPANRRGAGGRHPVVTLIDAGLRGQIHTAVLAEYARVRARAGKAAP